MENTNKQKHLAGLLVTIACVISTFAIFACIVAGIVLLCLEGVGNIGLGTGYSMFLYALLAWACLMVNTMAKYRLRTAKSRKELLPLAILAIPFGFIFSGVGLLLVPESQLTGLESEGELGERTSTLRTNTIKEKNHMNGKVKRILGNVFGYILLVTISVIWLVPFFCLVCQSFRVESTVLTNYVIPMKWGFDNYVYLFSADSKFITWYYNTYIIALAVCIFSTIIILAMSYTLSRFRFKLRKPLMNIMLIFSMFPGFLTMIILYNILKDLNMTQEHALPGLILVSIASSGMGYYVSKGFFDTIPQSLDEAARVDGANRAQVFFKVILPLAKPIVIYTILISFMAPWADFIFAKYVAMGASAGYNVAVGLWAFLQKDMISQHFTHFCAGGVVVSIPVIALFLLLQRYYVEGVTGGAVKG